MFDLHVHAGPCVAHRRADDVDTVAAYAAAGFDGLVLKGHCEPTVGRAVAAARAVAATRTDSSSRAAVGLNVHGGLVLNAPAGGFNPVAVESALTLGARVVWLPTVDARAHHAAGLAHPPSCAPALPRGPGFAAPPLDAATEQPLRTIFASIARADAVLATGHLGAVELPWVVATARELGVRRILLTHPTFTVPDLEVADIDALLAPGVFAEFTTYQLLHQPGMDAGRLAAIIERLGPERCVLSSDAGQPDSPPGPAALQLLVDALIDAGLDAAAVVAMASTQPRQLVER